MRLTALRGQYPGKLVVIDVLQGVATVRALDRGVKVVIRDYDCQDAPLKDECGEQYAMEEFEL